MVSRFRSTEPLEPSSALRTFSAVRPDPDPRAAEALFSGDDTRGTAPRVSEPLPREGEETAPRRLTEVPSSSRRPDGLWLG